MIDLTHDTSAWVAISFAGFAAIIWWKARGAITGMMDERIDAIRREIETAENLRAEAQKLLNEYERKQIAALKEAETAVENARQQAEKIRTQAERELNETIQFREKQVADRIARMKQLAIEDIQRYAAELSIKASAEIIQSKTDAPVRDRLIEQSIGALPKNIH